jgi:hypothetical protein
VNFQPELAAKVMSGQKTVTRRATSDNPRSPWWRKACSLKPGRDYAVCPGRGKHAIGRVRVHKVEKGLLADALVKPEAYLEGFMTAQGFRRAWEGMHGSFDPDQLVWVVRFEVVRGG